MKFNKVCWKQLYGLFLPFEKCPIGFLTKKKNKAWKLLGWENFPLLSSPLAIFFVSRQWCTFWHAPVHSVLTVVLSWRFVGSILDCSGYIPLHLVVFWYQPNIIPHSTAPIQPGKLPWRSKSYATVYIIIYCSSLYYYPTFIHLFGVFSEILLWEGSYQLHGITILCSCSSIINTTFPHLTKNT